MPIVSLVLPDLPRPFYFYQSSFTTWEILSEVWAFPRAVHLIRPEPQKHSGLVLLPIGVYHRSASPQKISNPRDVIRPCITAALAVPQISTHSLPTFPGPYSPSVLHDRITSLETNLKSSYEQWRQGHLKEEKTHQCNGFRSDFCSQDKVHMSQGPSPPLPASPLLDDKPQALPARESRILPPITDNFRPVTERPGPQSATSTQDASDQPCTPGGLDQWHSRPIGVQNLLNPTTRASGDNQNRRRPAEHFDFRPSLSGGSPGLPPTSSSHSPTDAALPSISPSTSAYPPLAGLAPRRILTPRSLSAYATNPGTVNPPTATIDARISPFITSKDRTGSDTTGPPESSFGSVMPGVPQGFPTAPGRRSPGRRPSGGNLQLQNFLNRRGSGGSAPQPIVGHSESPSTSYSSYSRRSHTPPATHPNASVNQPSSSYFGSTYNGNGTASAIPQMGLESKDSYSPATSSVGQSTYHLMTLDTEQGPIQVPVDVQAASKVADEKRKRNATASHRFRQRRKEKERETSSNIAKLEHQVREITEERDYYRSERDYFRSLSASIPSHVHVAPRPPSPRHVRQAQLGASGTFVNGPWHEFEENNRGARNTRRRTSNYVPAPGPSPQAPAPPAMNRYAQMPSNGPDTADSRLSAGNRTLLPGQVASQSGPFDPSTAVRGWTSSQ